MHRRCLAALASLALGLLPLELCAATSGVSATGFTVTIEREIRATPARVYAALGQVGQWWSKEHTWSGDSTNLSLELKAGGCFCERWKNNSVEHGHVINATQDQLLRLHAPLGPLQGLPVTTVLTFELAAKGDITALRTTFIASGGGMDLSQLAAPVDTVLTEQVKRLASFVGGK